MDKTNDKKAAIILSGMIGAGKTTVANYLKEKHNYSHKSYVDLVFIPILKERNLEICRSNLQDLGEELVSKYGLRGLARLILPFIKDDENIVIDDIRNLEVFDELNKSLSQHTILIFIKTDINNRVPRLKIRDGLQSKQELIEVEARTTEIHIGEIESEASYIINNNSSLKTLYCKIDDIVKQLEEMP